MEAKKSKFEANVKATLTCSAVCLLWGCAAHSGSRNGQVFDAITEKPIEGTVVSYTWRYEGFLEDAIGGGGAPVTCETLTDKEGKYFIPDTTIERDAELEVGLESELVIVYKDKYGVYIRRTHESVGRTFEQKETQPYREKNNIVKLYPWQEGQSHFDHVEWIRAWTQSSAENKLLLKELEPEKKRVYK